MIQSPRDDTGHMNGQTQGCLELKSACSLVEDSDVRGISEKRQGVQKDKEEGEEKGKKEGRRRRRGRERGGDLKKEKPKKCSTPVKQCRPLQGSTDAESLLFLFLVKD